MSIETDWMDEWRLQIKDGLHLIPNHMHSAVLCWLAFGLYPGSFLRAVLRNELVDACAQADETNRAAIFDWAAFLYNYMPSDSWHSVDVCRAWHEKRKAAHKKARETPPSEPAPVAG